MNNNNKKTKKQIKKNEKNHSFSLSPPLFFPFSFPFPPSFSSFFLLQALVTLLNWLAALGSGPTASSPRGSSSHCA